MKILINDYAEKKDWNQPTAITETVALIILTLVPLVLCILLLAVIRNYEGWLFRLLERMGL